MTATSAPEPTVTRTDGAAGGELAVDVRGLGRTFGSGTSATTVIEHLDLAVPAGQFVALLGASGCGKSTLLRVLAGLDGGVTGDVTVARNRAVAFQAPRLLPWKKVWRNVVLGVPGATRETALAALREVRLEHRADAWPGTLSGGEAQRASLARALVRQPDLLLLDEPFGALDALTRLTAQELVRELWHAHRPAVVLVTHDVDEALLLADRVLVMAHGRIKHDVPVVGDRAHGSAEYAEQRGRLLGWLGVHDGEAS